MVDAILLAVENSPLILQWRPIRTSIAALLDESSPPSLNRVITSISPSIPWFFWTRAEKTVARWAAAVSVVPYSREVCQDVVNTLLSLSADDSLRSHIPIEIWAWLKKQPTLPPTCLGRYNGSQAPVVRHVQGLGDIEFTKSYLLLVWSKWDSLWDDGFTEMQILIREDFGGVGMGRHREDLIKHLRLLLGKLGPSSLLLLRCFKPGIVEDDIQKREEQYRRLLDILLEVDEGAMEILTSTPPKSIPFDYLLILTGVFRIPGDLLLCFASYVSVIRSLEYQSSLGLHIGSQPRSVTSDVFCNPIFPISPPLFRLLRNPIFKRTRMAGCRFRCAVTRF